MTEKSENECKISAMTNASHLKQMTIKNKGKELMWYFMLILLIFIFVNITTGKLSIHLIENML